MCRCGPLFQEFCASEGAERDCGFFLYGVAASEVTFPRCSDDPLRSRVVLVQSLQPPWAPALNCQRPESGVLVASGGFEGRRTVPPSQKRLLMDPLNNQPNSLCARSEHFP